MQLRSRMTMSLLVLLLTALLIIGAAAPALAQETGTEQTTEETATAPTGLGTGVWLVGIGAIIFVGVMVVFRENFKDSGQDGDKK